MKDRRGAALMIVLWLIVILGVISTQLALNTRSAASVAANYRARSVARYAAESGVTAARAALEDSLARIVDAGARRQYLNQLDRTLGGRDPLSLGDARVAVALIDVGSRLDANTAAESSLASLFEFFTDALTAERAARALRAFTGGELTFSETEESLLAGGAGAGSLAIARPLRSLADLRRVPGVPRELAERVAGFLTVDGDGTINRATASTEVLAAAGGEMRDEPSRILVVSRGWLAGHPLTHEIQAVYAVVGRELTLIRWREQDL